jgi:hypothetical protein
VAHSPTAECMAERTERGRFARPQSPRRIRALLGVHIETTRRVM